MADSPQVESKSVLTLDFADSPKLREIFGNKDIGGKCKLTLELQLMSRYPEGVQLAIEKVITEDGGYDGEEEKEAEASDKHPIMATIKSKNRKNRGMTGPHGRPPEPVQNSAEPWMSSYA